MKRAYNELKLKALATFQERGWLSPPAWAVLAGYYSARCLYLYKATSVALEAGGSLAGPTRPTPLSPESQGKGAASLVAKAHEPGKLMMRAALYARVSTNAGQNPEMQLKELREYCSRRGWEISGEFVDTGISGSRERRPELDRMLAACRRRQIDAVVVYRYDRFARSLRQLVNALCEFDALGIQFISLHEGVDTSTPNGRLVFGIFASIAEFERELIRERVRSGIAVARAQGKRIGRPRRQVDAVRVAERRAQGWSWGRIAEEMGVGLGTVHRAGRKG